MAKKAAKGAGKPRGPKGAKMSFTKASKGTSFRGTNANRVKAEMTRRGYLTKKGGLTRSGIAFLGKNRNVKSYKGAGAMKKAMIRVASRMAGYKHAAPKSQKKKA